jgi:polyferredoxin/ferredoxin
MVISKTKPHRMLRWIIQISFLLLFVFFFIQTRYGLDIRFQNLFLKFDPLIFIIVSISERTIITAALLSGFLIIGSLFFGRFFCGFICPLGTSIDIFDTWIRKEDKSPRTVKNVKYLLLLILVIAAVIGSSLVHFVDPLVIFERSLTFVVYPVASFLLDSFVPLDKVVYTETFIALVVFVVVIGLGIIRPRLWCRSFCPLGGLLAVLSKFSLFKITFTESCPQCNICEKICPTGAIDDTNMTIDSAECIECLRCLYECPHKAITYTISTASIPFDITKRQLITAGGAGVLLAPLTRIFLHHRLNNWIIRPPGAVPESDFLNVCIRCSKCMKVCPTNGLQPCLFEAGINGLWTPRLVPRIGGCEKNCNMCGKVCPTSAIRKLSLEEKTYVRMGTAVIDRSTCIAWEQDKVCLICDEACPYNAINSLRETVRETTLLRPFVDERICTGCGLCESVCPIEGPAAIQVFSIGEERMKTGSYITEQKKQLRACEERSEDIPSGFILDDH